MASSFVRRGRRRSAVDAAPVDATPRDATPTRRDDASANRDGVDAVATRSRRESPRRDARAPTRAPGTRPGPHGRALASTGVGDADALLGGGHALGSLAAFASDGASGHAEALFGAYFVAEGAATTGHRTCWVREGGGGRDAAMRTLPRRARATREGEARDEGAEATRETKGDGLRIAWQYRRYLREGRSLDDSGVGAGRAATAATATKKRNLRAPDVCQTYDLTREEDEATLRDADVSFERFGGDEGDGEGDAWARCFEFVESFVRALRDEEVGRVLVQPETPRDEGEWRRVRQARARAQGVGARNERRVRDDSSARARAGAMGRDDSSRRRLRDRRAAARRSDERDRVAVTRAAPVRRARRRSQTSISRRRGVAADAHGSRVRATDAEKAHGDQAAADSAGGG